MILLLLFFLSSFASAAPTLRLDQQKIVDFWPSPDRLELIISDNCIHCQHQIEILKNCEIKKEVAVLVSNVSKATDEELKRILKKKKIHFPSYLLNEELKIAYKFKATTPTLFLKGLPYSGVVTCDFIQKTI